MTRIWSVPVLFLILPVAAVSAAQPAGLPAVTTTDPLATCATVQAAQSEGHAFEPQVALDPRTASSAQAHLVGVWQQDYTSAAAAGIVGAFSDDGARSWQLSPLPFTACVAGGLHTPSATDPWVAIGPDGTVYASAIGLAPSPKGVAFRGILVASSHDGGRTWTDTQAVPGTVGQSTDKDSIMADPTATGTAYVVWATAPANAPTATETALSETTDGGKTWSTPRVIMRAGPNTVFANDNQILVDPGTHALYDIFVRLERAVVRTVCKITKGRKRCHRAKRGQHFVISIIASHDRGARWTKPRVVGVAHFGSNAPPGLDHVGWPSEAIDPTSGDIYVVWENDRTGRVTLCSSRDGGIRWSRPHAVGPGVGMETLPAVAVGRQGDVFVTYDSILSIGQGMATTVSLAISHDHAAHFGSPEVIAGPSDLMPPGNPKATSATPGAFLGDYEALAAGIEAYPFFSLTDGDPSYHTHIYSTAISP